MNATLFQIQHLMNIGGLKLVGTKICDKLFHSNKYDAYYCKCLDEANTEKFKKIYAFQYKYYMGRKLNLDEPAAYTEKIQWIKVYENTPIKTTLSDKYLVRDWVKQKIGEQYLIPLLGVWDQYDQIDFKRLPPKFVLKSNRGSGKNYLEIVRDKDSLDFSLLKKKVDIWNKANYAYTGLQLHYKQIEPKIIAEKFIETEYEDLPDYKFLCFNGEPKFCWVDVGRYHNHTRNVYDMDWNLQEWIQGPYNNSDEPVVRPKNFDKMVSLARVLCEGFSHVRVDFYNIDGTIYFGEMTFTNGNGFEKIRPEEYDYKVGDLWKL